MSNSRWPQSTAPTERLTLETSRGLSGFFPASLQIEVVMIGRPTSSVLASREEHQMRALTAPRVEEFYEVCI